MFKDNLLELRKLNHMTQEKLAEKIGVSRQTIAKWEAGHSYPDLERSVQLAEVFDITLDELASSDESKHFGLPPVPKSKHLFGVVSVGDKGQIVIPAKARKIFTIVPGDKLVVLGDESQGIALMKAEDFIKMTEAIRDLLNKNKEMS